MNTVYAIVDCQFGSTGKGLFAGYLARKFHPDTVVSAFGPNSGHTFIDGVGRKFVNIMLPNGIVSPNLKRVLIGPGAIINPEIMWREINNYVESGHLVSSGAHSPVIAIHESACVVQDRHRALEGGYGALIGSTMKGTGAALAEKITRATPKQPIIARDALRGTPLEEHVYSKEDWNELMDSAEVMQIEGCQGFSLSVNQGMYPYVTSRDCTTAQLLADIAFPMGLLKAGEAVEVYGVARTFPIRVNNRGHSSGPAYPDQREIAWKDIGKEPELTTVTKLERRIFTFSEKQIAEAVRINAIDKIFLNFCNYVDVGHMDPDAALLEIKQAVQRHAPIGWEGWGPTEVDIQEK